MNMNTNLKISIESEQTWKKLERDSEKAGYRDGINEGRESNFQSSFDLGYKEGFKNGYAIGKYKGALNANSKVAGEDHIKNPLLEKISKGWCQICPSKDISNLNIEEAITLQSKASNRYLSEMYPKYKEKANISLPKEV